MQRGARRDPTCSGSHGRRSGSGGRRGYGVRGSVRDLGRRSPDGLNESCNSLLRDFGPSAILPMLLSEAPAPGAGEHARRGFWVV